MKVIGDKDKMFEQVRTLCKLCGMSIAKISEDCNMKPKLVADMFIETMKLILEKMEKENG